MVDLIVRPRIAIREHDDVTTADLAEDAVLAHADLEAAGEVVVEHARCLAGLDASLERLDLLLRLALGRPRTCTRARAGFFEAVDDVLVGPDELHRERRALAFHLRRRGALAHDEA